MAKAAESSVVSESSEESCGGENGALAADSNLSAAIQLPRVERAVRGILLAVGEIPDGEGLWETPARVAPM